MRSSGREWLAVAAAIIITITGAGIAAAQPTHAGQGASWSWDSDDPARVAKSRAARAMESGDVDTGIQILTDASSSDPFDDSLKDMLADAYRMRGWERFAAGKYDDSMSDFRKASVNEQEKHEETYLGLGVSSYKLRDNDDALYYLYEAAYLNPDDWHAHDLIAGINYGRGKLEEAIDEWETALRLSPDNEPVEANLAKARREFEVEGEFNNTDTYYFNIKYEGDEKRELGDMVLDILSAAYRDIGSDLDYYPREPVAVILYTREQFSDVTDAPTWSSGIFDGNIRVPVGGKVDRKALEAVLYHEYAHAVTGMIAGNSIPTWLAEGVAMHEERWVRGSGRGGGFRVAPLSSLSGPFLGMSDTQAREAYLQSVSVVEFMSERFGQYSLAKLLRLLGEGEDIATAVHETTGLSFSDFEDYWRSYVSG